MEPEHISGQVYVRESIMGLTAFTGHWYTSVCTLDESVAAQSTL